MQSSILHRLLWGFAVIAIGVIFLLNQIGVTNFTIGELISTYWPIIMILVGVQGLLQRSREFFWSGIIIMFGIYFLGRNLEWFDKDFSEIVRYIGPIAIILFGINLIFRGNRPCRPKQKHQEHEMREHWNPITPPNPPVPPGPPPAPPEWDDLLKKKDPAGEQQPMTQNPMTQDPYTQQESNKTEESKNWSKNWWEGQDWHNKRKENLSRFIGDVHLGDDYWELNPMNISHFIGDTTLDLTKAHIPVGETKIYVSTFIGDVKVYVPNDFSVGIQVVSSCLIGDVKVLGQKREGFMSQISVATPSYSDADKRVVLVVSSFIGDVRVTKVG